MPPSRSQVDAAGRRIRHDARNGIEPAEADLAVVRAFRELHLESVVDLSESIQNLRQILLQEFDVPAEAADLWEVAARPKTEDAIVGKLRRSSTSLSSMQDISGVRLVVPTLEIQDFVLEVVITAMTDRGHNPRVKDTRAEGDELGYRAIHVILDWPPRKAELQLRTRVQQVWAQLVERLDQTLGTDFKHGAGPAPIQAWLRTMSAEGRKGELGLDFDLPPFPDEPQ